MNFAAVKDFFKPVPRSEREALARRHAGLGGERSIGLEEVGIEGAARQAAARAKQDSAARQNDH